MVPPSSLTASRVHSGETPFSMTALAPDDEASEPVHFCARMVQGRNKDEIILLGLEVVAFLRDACGDHVLVGQKDRFWLACCSRREIEAAGIIDRQ